jgi:hypothetical protein
MSIDAAFAQDSGTGLFVPVAAVARRSVIPWDDLNAANIPLEWSQISKDLVTSLSILAAQGADAPKLLSVDSQNNLRVGARLNASTKFAAHFVGGSTVATVLDTSDFLPGDHVALLTNGAPGSVCIDVVIFSIDSPTQMTFVASCVGQSFNPGDFVVGEQVVNIRQIFEGVNIDRVNGVNVGSAIPVSIAAGLNISQIGGVAVTSPLPVSEKALSWDGSTVMAENAAGAQGTCTLPAVPGKHWVCKELDGQLTAAAGFAGNDVRLRLIDGPSGGAALLRTFAVGAPTGIGTMGQVSLSGLRIIGSVNTQMTLEFSSGIPNAFQSGGFGADLL